MGEGEATSGDSGSGLGRVRCVYGRLRARFPLVFLFPIPLRSTWAASLMESSRESGRMSSSRGGGDEGTGTALALAPASMSSGGVSGGGPWYWFPASGSEARAMVRGGRRS